MDIEVNYYIFLFFFFFLVIRYWRRREQVPEVGVDAIESNDTGDTNDAA